MDDHSDWTGRASLPKIRLTRIPPVLEAEAFQPVSIPSGWKYTHAGSTPAAPFETDAEAEKLARKFLLDHFGPIPFDLKTGRISRSASGRDRPFDNTDRGHTVLFNSYWHGIEINGCSAVIYIQGQTINSATINLGEPTVLPNSERIVIARSKAIEEWRQVVVKHFKAAQDITPQVVNLVFVWSGPYDPVLEEDKVGSVLSPQWEIKTSPHADALLVDAYSGKVWRND